MTELPRMTFGTRILLVTSVSVVTGTVTPSRSSVAQESAAESMAAQTTEEYTIGSLRVIHRHRPASQVVAVRLFLLGGTQQLTELTQGIEALYLTAAEVETQRAMALIGAQTIVETHVDWTVAGFVTLREDFAAVWNAFAGWFGPAVPVDSAILRGRNLLTSAARRRHTHPDLRIQVIARQGAFAGHPYALDPYGTVASLMGFKTEDLERYRTEQFLQSRMLLVVVGDVARATVDSLAANTLGRLPVGAYTWAPPPAAPDHDMAWMAEHRPLATNYILGYFDGPNPRDHDYFAFQIATALLSSRLFRAVRADRSLSYAAYAPFLDYGVSVGGVYASTAEPAEVYNVMLEQMNFLRSYELPTYVLRDFQSQFTLDRLSEQMTNESQAEALGRAAIYFGDFRMAEKGWDEFRRVSATLVRRAAERYMRDFRLAYLGDTTQMTGRW